MITALSQEHNFRLVTESGASYTVRESHFDLVLQMTNTGARTVTLPTNPPHLQRITIRDAAGTAFSANITIVNGAIPTDIAVINVNDDAVTLIYDQPSNKWLNDAPSLDDRYELTTEATNTYTVVATQIPTTVLMGFNGARTVNLPAAPINGQRVVIVDQANVASDATKRITITPAGGKTCDVASVDLNGDVASLIYIASQNNWKTANQIEARFYEVVEATATYNVAASLHTTYVYMSNTGARTVNLPASPVSGQRVVIKDQASTAATANITITPAGGKTCEVANIAANGGAADLMYNASLNSWRSLVSLPITYSAENLVDLTVSTGKAVTQDAVVQMVSGAGVEDLAQVVSFNSNTVNDTGMDPSSYDFVERIPGTTNAFYSAAYYTLGGQGLVRRIMTNGTNTPTISSGTSQLPPPNQFGPISGGYLTSNTGIMLGTYSGANYTRAYIFTTDSNTNTGPQFYTNGADVTASGYYYDGKVCIFPGNTNTALVFVGKATGDTNTSTITPITISGTNISAGSRKYNATGTNYNASGVYTAALTSNKAIFAVEETSTANGVVFCCTNNGTNTPTTSGYSIIGSNGSGSIVKSMCKINSTTALCLINKAGVPGYCTVTEDGTNQPVVSSVVSFSNESSNRLPNIYMSCINIYINKCLISISMKDTNGTAVGVNCLTLSYAGTNVVTSAYTNTLNSSGNYNNLSNFIDKEMLLVSSGGAQRSYNRLTLTTSATGTSIGIARSSATGGNPASVSVGPIVTGLSGLTVGAKYYAQDGSGLLGTTTTSIYVGVALTTTKLLLQL